MIKYRTRWGEIKAIEVLRETDKMVVLKGSLKEYKEAKRSVYQNWFDSFKEAKAFLIEGAKKNVETAHNNLERAKERLEKLIVMSENET